MKQIQIKELRIAYSQIKEGNMSVKYSRDALENQARFLRQLNFSGKNVIANLTGNDEIISVDGISSSQVDAEGLMTKDQNTALMILTADCIPAVLYDQERGMFGLLHLSRINSDKGLLKKMVKVMTSDGSDVQNIKLILGPGVRAQSYSFERLPEALSDWSNFTSKKVDKSYIDIFGFNRELAIDSGIAGDNITDLEIDTFPSVNFFSHRKSQVSGLPEGRFLTVASMQELDAD